MIVFNLKQAAEIVGLHPQTLKKYVDSGELKAVLLESGRKTWRISQADLEVWWQNKGGGTLFPLTDGKS